MSGPLIAVSVAGFSHTTPIASDSKGVTPGVFRGMFQVWIYEKLLKKRFPPDQTYYLNPGCSEAVMGWPIGWARLKPLATAKFRSWLRRHGVSSGPGSKKKSKKCPT
jgi:hypothetical protein